MWEGNIDISIAKLVKESANMSVLAAVRSRKAKCEGLVLLRYISLLTSKRGSGKRYLRHDSNPLKSLRTIKYFRFVLHRLTTSKSSTSNIFGQIMATVSKAILFSECVLLHH